MTLGSMIEADKRLREHEHLVRRQKRFARDAAVWQRYEDDVGGRHGVGVNDGGERSGVDDASRR